MATVTGFTADRMLEMEDATVIDGEVVGDDLILTTKGGTDINAGNVRGPQGPQGVPGVGVDEVWVGPDTPPTTQEFWYDTDALTPSYGGVPIGGETGQVLAKSTNDNYNTGWTHQNFRIFPSKAALDSAQWAGLIDGARAHCTDTGNDYVRRGGAWAICGWLPVSQQHVRTTTDSFPPNQWFDGPWFSLTAPVGSRMRITANIILRSDGPGATDLGIGLGVDGGAGLTSWVYGTSGAAGFTIPICVFFTTTAASHTYKASIFSNPISAAIYAGSTLEVERIG